MVNNTHRRSGAGHGVVQRLFARLADLGVAELPGVVAFSGGGDSTALAAAIAEARRADGRRVWLGHVMHGVRPDAAKDLPVVLRTAEQLSLPLCLRPIADGAIASHRGCGLEEAMRRERYARLSDILTETVSQFLLTAHHAGDQAETVLGHLIRGSGMEGVVGIRPITSLTVPWWRSPQERREITVVRPFLRETRSILHDLVTTHGLSIVVDETNDDTDRTRAAIRHRVLPVLDEIHHDAAMSIATFAEIAGRRLDEIQPGQIDQRGDDPPTPATLGQLTVGQQRGHIRRWVNVETGLALTFERTEAIRRWLMADGSGAIQLGEGWSIRRRGRTISTRRDAQSRRPDET